MKKLNCVLLVDDDYVTNFLHENLLRDLDLASCIKVAKNGEEALQYIKSSSIDQGGMEKNPIPDLILLDVNMPVMNGFEFLEEFEGLRSKLDSKIPLVIMVTSSDDKKDMDQAQRYHITGYVHKPLTEAKVGNLLQMVEDAKGE